MARTPIHSIWKTMRQRCLNPKNFDYKYYGARGITICERWDKFENFFEDMGHRPEGLSLDRIDNEKGYSKENCKWSNQVDQIANSRPKFKIRSETKCKACNNNFWITPSQTKTYCSIKCTGVGKKNGDFK
jgi:hypothetical protein